MLPAEEDEIIDVLQAAGTNLTIVQNVYIHPNSKLRNFWNTLVTSFLLYNGIIIPVRIAFNIYETGGAFIFDRIIDATFIG